MSVPMVSVPMVSLPVVSLTHLVSFIHRLIHMPQHTCATGAEEPP